MGLSQGDRQTWVSFPQPLNGHLEIKSPLGVKHGIQFRWSGWKVEGLLMLFLHAYRAPLKAPDKPLGGTDTHSNQWQFLEHSCVLGQVLVTDRRYRDK